MTARPAWPIDTSVVSEVTCLRSGPSGARLLDSIADEDLGLGLRHRIAAPGQHMSCIVGRGFRSDLGSHCDSSDRVIGCRGRTLASTARQHCCTSIMSCKLARSTTHTEAPVEGSAEFHDLHVSKTSREPGRPVGLLEQELARRLRRQGGAGATTLCCTATVP